METQRPIGGSWRYTDPVCVVIAAAGALGTALMVVGMVTRPGHGLWYWVNAAVFLLLWPLFAWRFADASRVRVILSDDAVRVRRGISCEDLPVELLGGPPEVAHRPGRAPVLLAARPFRGGLDQPWVYWEAWRAGVPRRRLIALADPTQSRR